VSGEPKGGGLTEIENRMNKDAGVKLQRYFEEREAQKVLTHALSHSQSNFPICIFPS
jgi:hypothetical protein